MFGFFMSFLFFILNDFLNILGEMNGGNPNSRIPFYFIISSWLHGMAWTGHGCLVAATSIFNSYSEEFRTKK